MYAEIKIGLFQLQLFILKKVTKIAPPKILLQMFLNDPFDW